MKKANGKAAPSKLDLGCGENKREGFLGVDLYAATDFKVDLTKFPWPFRDNSVEEVWCSHFFEHIPGLTRIPWMDELYRILINDDGKGPDENGIVHGGTATIIVPYWSSARSIQDPSHQWPPIAEQSFLYYNQAWRTANKLNHYLGKCDFDFGFGYFADQETATKSQETQAFYVKHYLQAVNDLQVVLRKRHP